MRESINGSLTALDKTIFLGIFQKRQKYEKIKRRYMLIVKRIDHSRKDNLSFLPVLMLVIFSARFEARKKGKNNKLTRPFRIESN